jgi:hypothetical protein
VRAQISPGVDPTTVSYNARALIRYKLHNKNSNAFSNQIKVYLLCKTFLFTKTPVRELYLSAVIVCMQGSSSQKLVITQKIYIYQDCRKVFAFKT